ncbi:MAG: RluA family pseudouridine synthase [Elainellaceae cyanobacterium]
MAMNRGWVYREQVDKKAAGQTVLDYYVQRYHHSSTAEWQQRIEAGQVTLNGGVIASETLLNGGQWLAYHRPPWDEPEVALDIPILYEDEDVWAVNKPSGLPVLPGAGFLEHTLLRQLQNRYPHENPVPIHRLGRGTSGLMLIARSPLARSSLSQQLRDRQIRKVYRALVGDWNLGDRLTITQPIGKIPHPTLGYVYGAAQEGRIAHSECDVLERRADSTLSSTLLSVAIATGRPHQIRIHLASVGFPLIGDPLYGVGGSLHPDVLQEKSDRVPVPGDCGYFLHAYQVAFRHPRTGKILELECQPPAILRCAR